MAIGITSPAARAKRTLCLCAYVPLCLLGAGFAGEAAFTAKPTVTKAGEATTIQFAVSAPTDVEVSILDAKGAVVRHLAAGALGAQAAPPAPLKSGLTQFLEWDGKDDYGEPPPSTLHPQPFSARVRIGMGVKLEKIAGGDPYAWFSWDMGLGDHAAWKMTGLVAKSDGSVYVMGNASNIGPPAIRCYDAEGNYRRTVFPFPAGLPAEKVKGWGVTVQADGTYLPLYSDLASPALSKTPIAATRGGCASLLPSSAVDTLAVAPIQRWDKGADASTAMIIGTDGSLPELRIGPAPKSEQKPPAEATCAANKITVRDSAGKTLREIACQNAEVAAVSPNSKALYVVTRIGDYHKRGNLQLLKFNDWSKDAGPAETIMLIPKQVGIYHNVPSRILAMEHKGKVLVWIVHTMLPVRVYRDGGAKLELVKDFYEAGPQRCLDVQHMAVDPKTEDLYIADGFKNAFRITDWKNPRFESCMTAEGQRLVALSVAIDARNRYLITHDYIRGKVTVALRRYQLDGKYLAPAPVGKTGDNAISGQRVSNDWRIGLGLSQRGIAAGPDGSVAALGTTEHTDYSGPLYIFQHDAEKAPWAALHFAHFGKPASGGIRFDPAGNLYAGLPGSGGKKPASIVKYAPTGSLKSGCLFPREPEKPVKVYDVPYGYSPQGFSRTPRFGVDGWGRIYYPTSLESRVSVVDNEGNPVLAFGTYGNRDSMGGLEGDLVPTKGVPMAWPNSVDATDDYIYVSDMVNIRVLRLAKTFAAAETVGIK